MICTLIDVNNWDGAGGRVYLQVGPISPHDGEIFESCGVYTAVGRKNAKSQKGN